MIPRTISLILLLFFVFVASPAADATETTSKTYRGGSVSVLGYSVGILFTEGPPNEDGEPFPPSIGGSGLHAEEEYNNAVVSIADDIYGPDGGQKACMESPEEGDIVQRYCTDDVCGTNMLLGSPYASDQLNVWTRAILIGEDLDVCGATTGTVTAMFF